MQLVQPNSWPAGAQSLHLPKVPQFYRLCLQGHTCAGQSYVISDGLSGWDRSYPSGYISRGEATAGENIEKMQFPEWPTTALI